MLLFNSFLLFLALSTVSNTATNLSSFKSSKKSVSFSIEPLYSRTCGLAPEPTNSYLTSLLSIYYSIPKIQEAFYLEASLILYNCTDSESSKKELAKSSLIVATAVLFAHMRMGKRPLNLDDYYYDACTRELGFNIKNFSLYLDSFFEMFNTKLSPAITSIYKHQLWKYPTDARKEFILTRLNLETPPILFFDIPRLNKLNSTTGDFIMNQEIVFIETRIKINHVDYVLVGLCGFDINDMKYSTKIFDFRNELIYEMIDGNFHGPSRDPFPESIPDNNSVLIVYVRSDTLNQVNLARINTLSDIPESVKLLWQYYNENSTESAELVELSNNSFFIELFNDADDESSPISSFDADDSTSSSDTTLFKINPEIFLTVQSANSYLSSVLMAIYNIPDFRRAFYADANDLLSSDPQPSFVIVAVAAVLAQMTLPGENVKLEEYLIENLSEMFTNNRIGDFLSFSVFILKFLEVFGPKIKEMIAIDCEIKFTASTRQITKFFRKKNYFIPVSVNTFNGSISQCTGNQLLSSVSINISPTELIEGQLSTNILQCSKYLFFEVGRIQASSLNLTQFILLTTPLWIDSEITVEGNTFILVSRIEYNNVSSSYETIIKDFSTNNVYKFIHDGRVTLYPNNLFSDVLDEKSVFLIYAEKLNFFTSYKDEIEIPESLKAKIEELKKIQEESQSGKRKRDDDDEDENFWLQIYKPDYSKYTDSDKILFFSMENHLKQFKAKNYSIDALNLLSKFIYGTYTLGSEEYSFEQGSFKIQCLSLELLLLQLASSVSFVLSLFEFVQANPDKKLEMALAVTIVKMLLGCKNIPLNYILQELETKLGDRFILLHSTQQAHHNFGTQFKTIFDQFDHSLLCLPTIKQIIYPNLETNDPASVSNSRWTSVKANKLIKANQDEIKGIWFDSVHSSTSIARIRNIYNSNCPIFPIEIVRHTQKNTIVELEINSLDKTFEGFISIIPAGGHAGFHLKSQAFDKFSGKYRSMSIDGKSISFEPTNENFISSFNSEKLKNSIQLFITSKEDQVTVLSSRIIPKVLIPPAVDQFLRET